MLRRRPLQDLFFLFTKARGSYWFRNQRLISPRGAQMSLSVNSQFRWSVDQTAGGAIPIMKGLIQAATSDNVQPCRFLERFPSLGDRSDEVVTW